MKRFLTLCLAVTMVVGMTLPAAASTHFNWTYEEDSGWVLREYPDRDDWDSDAAYRWDDDAGRWVSNWDEHWKVTTASTAVANWTEDSVVFLQPDETFLKKGRTVYVNRKKNYSSLWSDDKVEKWTAVTVQDLIDAGYKNTRVLVLKDSTTELKKGSVLRINEDYEAIVSSTGKKRTTLSAEEKSDKDNNLEIDLRW